MSISQSLQNAVDEEKELAVNEAKLDAFYALRSALKKLIVDSAKRTGQLDELPDLPSYLLIDESHNVTSLVEAAKITWLELGHSGIEMVLDTVANAYDNFLTG